MIKKCLNCGEVKTQSILNFGYIPITSLLSNEESFPLNYGKCEKCFVVSTINSLPQNILYGKDYNFFSSTSNAYIAYTKIIISTIESIVNINECDVLEIGCNDCVLMHQIESKVKSVVGIDPFFLATESFNNNNKATIINDYFNNDAVKNYNLNEKFDVVIVNNVITHVDDVFDFIKALSLVVKKNGIIYFEMCDYKKVIENDRFDYFYHGVTNLILPNQIERLLKGFECIKDYGFDGFDPFSNKFILQKTNSNIENNNFPNDQINSAQLKLDSWCKKINIFFNNLSNFKKVVGYGANSKSGIVFALSPIAKQKIDVILDINLNKHNKIISGSSVQIKHIDRYDISEIDCIILFASHIFEEVKHALTIRGYTGKLLMMEL